MKIHHFLLLTALGATACAGGGVGNPVAKNAALRVLSGQSAEGGQHYAGTEVCSRCHSVRFRRWSASVHAASMESLRQDGKEGSPSCLRCHATGFGTRTGHGGTRPGRGLSAVTCEACHGPSGEHAASRFPALVRTPGAADCNSCEVVRICRECHTPRHSPLFDLQGFLEKIACSMDVTEGVSAR